MGDVRTTVSIVVTTYNDARFQDVIALMESICAQRYCEIEVILVVEGSKTLYDNLASYLEENSICRVQLIFSPKCLGLSSARNLGIEASKGDIIAFVDDDVILGQNWAEQMVKSYGDSSIIGVTGPALPLWEDESMSWLPKELYWLIGCTAWCDWKGMRKVRNVWGMNMSFRREAFKSTGGFSKEIGGVRGRRLHGEETELSIRVIRRTGKTIVYNPDVKVCHKVRRRRLTTLSIARASYWMGYTRHQLKTMFPPRCRSSTDLLEPEHQLLKSILTELLPKTFRAFFPSPRISCRKIWITALSLTFVFSGYLSHLFIARANDIPREA